MRYLLTFLPVLLFFCSSIQAQDISRIDAILNFIGVDDPQKIDSDEVERLENLMDSPIRINILSETELRAYGLFTPYQVAVISDYISRHGHIMSMTELSLLDGFGLSFVHKILPFVSFKSYDSTSGRLQQDVAIRGGVKWNENYDGNYGAKYRLEFDDRLTATVAASRSSGSDSWSPTCYTGSLAYRFKLIPVRVVAGDFNARFGQGLVLWSNSFLNTLTAPDTFMKKPSGITQPWSFTGSNLLHGMAAVIDISKIQVSAIAAFEDMQFTPALNVAWHCRYGFIDWL